MIFERRCISLPKALIIIEIPIYIVCRGSNGAGAWAERVENGVRWRGRFVRSGQLRPNGG
jgi:hypothetical protein